MLSQTHMVCGIAASLLVVQPSSPGELALAVIGGALGGSVPDIDTVRSKTNVDSVITQTMAVGIAAVTVALDWYYRWGILNYLRSHPGSFLTGAVFYGILMVIGFYSSHRSFTHSIPGMLLFVAAVGIMYPNLIPSYAAGYGSHIVLDLLNRKPVMLLYPLKRGFCLKLCYSNRSANKWLFTGGGILSIVMIMRGVLLMV